MAFQPKYSAEQRAAIIGAVLDDAHTVPEAVKAAALGELGPAFTITPGAAYGIVAKAKGERCDDLPIEAIAESIARRVLARCHRDLARLEQLPELGPADVRVLQGLSKLARQAKLLARDGSRAAAAPAAQAQQRSGPSGLAARIAAEHAATPDAAAEEIAERLSRPALTAKVRASRHNGHTALKQ